MDAFRLKLLLPLTQQRQDAIAAEELKQLSLSNGATGSSDSLAASGDVSSKQGSPHYRQHEEEQHELKQAGSGKGGQGTQLEQANDLNQRLDALQT